MSDNISRQAAIDALCKRCDLVHDVPCTEECNDIKILRKLPSTDNWIPVTERMPEAEQEVLVTVERKLKGQDAYICQRAIPAIYEDGTVLECDSNWYWDDIDYAGWDEEEDCGIIPEGWWENRHYNYGEDCNNYPIDDKVVAWVPLPPVYQGE